MDLRKLMRSCGLGSPFGEEPEGVRDVFEAATTMLSNCQVQRSAAASSLARASTQRPPSGVCSFFQNGARVLR